MDRQPARYFVDAPHDFEDKSRPAVSPSAVDRRRGRRRRTRDDDAPREDGSHVVILIPVYNDWASLALLLPALDAALGAHFRMADVLIVDDGSITPEPNFELEKQPFTALRRIDVLRLRRNLGHQRAIAIGLAYIEERLPATAVVVMDGDGEDDPADVPRLLERLDDTGGGMVVFAERARRSESRGFRFFYALFKLVHLLLTGRGVRVGNFSAIPRKRLASLVVVAEVWNHYAAAVFRSRQPHCLVPTYRARRLSGRSSMNFVSLVTHGLSAISVYSDIVGVRLLVVSIVLAGLMLAGIAGAVIVRLATSWAIPGWASTTVGLLLILFIQAVMAAFMLSFVVLGSRHGMTFLPRRDYAFFIDSVDPISNLTPAAVRLPDLKAEGVATLSRR